MFQYGRLPHDLSMFFLVSAVLLFFWEIVISFCLKFILKMTLMNQESVFFHYKHSLHWKWKVKLGALHFGIQFSTVWFGCALHILSNIASWIV